MGKRRNSSARHSREERLKNLAEQGQGEGNQEAEGADERAESASDDAIDADATVAIGARARKSLGETVPHVEEAGDETTRLDPHAVRPLADDAFDGFDKDAAGFPLSDHVAEEGSYVSQDFSEIPLKRKRRALRAFGISAGVVIALLLVAYIAGAVVFMGRFLPNTFIGDNDLSMKTDEEVETMLDGVVDNYQLDVVGAGFTYQISGADVGMSIDSAGIVQAMHNDLDAWTWPVLMLEGSHDESRHLTIAFKRDDCEKDVNAKVKKFNKDAKAPVDATIAFNEETGKYEVKPEEEGTQLNAKKVRATITEAVAKLQPHATLTEDHLKKPKVYSDDEKLIESAELATGMVSAHVSMILNGQNVAEVGSEELSQFVSIDDKLDVKFKEDDLNSWVAELAGSYDTIGAARNYTRDDGKQITVKGGSYGWEIDEAATRQALLDAIKSGGESEVDVPCVSTAAVWTAAGERDWGNRYLDVDLSEQHVRFYGDNGKIIWQTDFISGTPDGKHDTWEGVWYVNNKESPSTLIGYTDDGKKDYETEVQYWMPFEGNGIGFHDASWQPDFGGTMYQDGYGSHGCINLDPSDAKKLYGMVEIGDVVVVHS